jgi:hypothetical protein
LRDLVNAQLYGTLDLTNEQISQLKPILEKHYFNYRSLKDEMPNLAIAARCVKQSLKFFGMKTKSKNNELKTLKDCLNKVGGMVN